MWMIGLSLQRLSPYPVLRLFESPLNDGMKSLHHYVCTSSYQWIVGPLKIRFSAYPSNRLRMDLNSRFSASANHPGTESRCKSIGIFSYPYHFRNEWQRVAQGGSGWHRKDADSEAEIAVILRPSDRACPWNTTTRVIRQYTNPSEGGFLLALANSKMSFQLLKRI